MTALISSLAFLMLQDQGDGGGGGSAAGGGVSIGGMIFALVILAFFVIVGWKIFEKAGQPGWAAIVPIYNAIVMLKIVGRPVWWIILLLIPGVGFIVSILVSIDLARKFGKGTGFGIGLAFLGLIFAPILAFGDAQYNPAA